MKYLFGCTNEKGKTYLQTPKDVSQKDSSKSAYYDIKDEKLETFWIEGDGNKILVSLQDGHFEINGAKVFLHEEEELSEMRLIYYRQNTIDFQGSEPIKHEVTFCIGWQANDKNGKNVKHIIKIK